MAAQKPAETSLGHKGCSPRFIVFEGIDGSGKTTQARLLAERLQDKGFLVTLTSEPSDGPIGRAIASLETRPSPEEEARLFIEDRRDHLERVILPALGAGQTVICDRYIHSSAAYQGARGLDPKEILRRNLVFARLPDLVLLIEVPVDLAMSRIASGRVDGFSTFEEVENLRAVNAVYERMSDPVIRRIDGSESVKQVHRRVLRAVCPWKCAENPSAIGSEKTSAHGQHEEQD
jgi:dTMP kinase